MAPQRQTGTPHPASGSRPDVRRAALEILDTLEQSNQTLDSAMQAAFDRAEVWSKRDRALLNALVYGVLRWRGRLDYIISRHSKTRLSRIDPSVLNILRLGLFQIGYLNRIPGFAAVTTSVELVKSTSAPWAFGFVNAVLRSVARPYPEVVFPDVQKDPVASLAATKSFPQWLIRRWLVKSDPERTAALCDAINAIPAITLRTNTLLVDRFTLAAALENEVENIELTAWAPDGVSIMNPLEPIPLMAPYRAGWFQVQDEAAQLVALFLNPQPGETILDACAGLGGKTGHIAQLMNNNGTIVALDKNKEKLSRLHLQMHRMAVSIVTTVTHDLNTPLEGYNRGHFDRILLDAPCSGLGVIRRNPDIKWNTAEKQLTRHGSRQLEFLDKLSHLVKPSGLLVYAVCSNETEENEDVTNNFLRRHPEFALDPLAGRLSSKASELIDDKGYLKTSPYPYKMDGFFGARFKRIR
ncbi:MAG: 16S rRNA (cytosine(967)-C(5))-methyltransferase RsmB [Desulfobacterales bacterium]|jgi:16S rRNA (cytosine967-C5)-methyltransferase